MSLKLRNVEEGILSYVDQIRNKPNAHTKSILSRISARHVQLCSAAGIASVPTDLGEPVKAATEFTKTDYIIEPIPEPPLVPDVVEEIANTLNALGEPTFESLGLGGWTPVAFILRCLEYVHVSCDVPWWATIAIGRLSFFCKCHILQRDIGEEYEYKFLYYVFVYF